MEQQEIIYRLPATTQELLVQDIDRIIRGMGQVSEGTGSQIRQILGNSVYSNPNDWKGRTARRLGISTNQVAPLRERGIQILRSSFEKVDGYLESLRSHLNIVWTLHWNPYWCKRNINLLRHCMLVGEILGEEVEFATWETGEREWRMYKCNIMPHQIGLRNRSNMCGPR